METIANLNILEFKNILREVVREEIKRNEFEFVSDKEQKEIEKLFGKKPIKIEEKDFITI